MGRTIITPPVPGIECEFCFGQGLPFGAVPAPSVASVVFTGIAKGPAWLAGDGEPPNKIYRLLQGAPCFYADAFPDTVVSLIWSAVISTLSIVFFGNPAFLAEPVEVCQLSFVNGLGGPFAKFVGGRGVVTL